MAVVTVVCAAWVLIHGDDNRRYAMGELSCASDIFNTVAIDFDAPPHWASPEQALEGALDVYDGVGHAVPPDGWVLQEPTDDLARWERRVDGHLVGVVQFQLATDRWVFAPIEHCADW